MVGEQHERPVERAGQLGRRIGVPRRGEARADAAVHGIRAGLAPHDGRRHADQAPGGGRRVVGGVAHAERAGDGDQRRHAAGPDGLGDRRTARRPGHRRPAPATSVGRQLAGPQQLGDLLERDVRARSATSWPR